MFRVLEHTQRRVYPGAHTDDERLGEASLCNFVEFLWQTVLEVSKPQ